MREITSAGILIKSGDKYLLAHANGRKPTTGWGLPKGRVDAGEALEQAAVRETMEECGLVISPNEIKPFTEVRYKSSDEEGKVMKTLKIFIHEGDESLQTKPLSCSTYFNPNWVKNSNVKIAEIDAYKWVTADEAKSLAMKSIKSIFDLL
jgi:8-oxo-dGTP pyrophosphatase MutT (NUDIX family)